MSRSICLGALVALGLGASGTAANTISLEPGKDNTLFQNANGLLSNGAGPHLFVGTNNGNTTRRGLLQFDVSVLPAGATVTAASLTLNVSQAQGATPQVALHRVTQAWGEGASNSGSPGGGGAASQAGDATWIHTFFNTGTWTNAGGDFVGTASAAGVPGFGSFTIASSPQLVADIQSWSSTPANNFGWALLGLETAGNVLRIDSRENTTPEKRPRLLIDFTPPTSTWAPISGGDWDDAGNWSGGVPDAAGVIATLGAAITNPQTVTLDSPRTVGELNFESAVSYEVAGATLTIQGFGAAGAVRSLSGSHTVLAPLRLATDTQLHAAGPADALTLAGGVFADSGVAITKTGGGTVVAPNIRAADLRIDGGALRIATNGSDAGTSRVSSLSVSAGSLDLRDNDLIVDYDGPSVASDIRAMIIDGRLASSSATAHTRLGYADNAVANLSSFSGQTIDATSIMVKFTYTGDANLDGQVDINDLAALATSWQSSGVWTNGDFDYSGLVDINDLAALATNWQAGVGAPLAQSFGDALQRFGINAVPEPAGVAVLALVQLMGRRRRRTSNQVT